MALAIYIYFDSPKIKLLDDIAVFHTQGPGN